MIKIRLEYNEIEKDTQCDINKVKKSILWKDLKSTRFGRNNQGAIREKAQ